VSCGTGSEPTDEADRGRHPGFARYEGLAGGPGSLSLSFGGFDMWVIYNKTLKAPDIAATSANLRRRFATITVTDGRSQAVTDELQRLQREPSVLERGSIATPEDVGVVNVDPEEDQHGSIRFMDAEILFGSPEERFSDYWELCNFVCQSVVMNDVKSGI
jgi:hypothetical protein